MNCRLILVALVFWVPFTLHAEPVFNFGHFDGFPQVELDPEGRNVRLLKDFSYFDPDEKVWTARQNFESDGASIPQVFWTFVGGPFEGRYRDAALIHDWYCKYKQGRWQDVHIMFYWASRARGVSEFQAKTLYLAVALFGPRWGQKNWRWPREFTPRFSHTVLVVKLSKDQAEDAVNWLKSNDPSLDIINFYVSDNYPVNLDW